MKRNYQQFGLCMKKTQILNKLQQTWRTSERWLGKGHMIPFYYGNYGLKV